MKNVRLFTVLGLLGVLAFIGCSKGTAGPAGAAGAAGPAGPAGPDSVLHSVWVQLALTANGTESVNGNIDTIYEEDFAAPGVTQNILDSGVVLSYLSFLDANNNINVFNASEAVQVTYALDDVSVFSVGVDYSYPNTGWSFRYVIVPGSMVTGNRVIAGPLKGYTKTQLQGMSYGTLQKLLGLSDQKSVAN